MLRAEWHHNIQLQIIVQDYMVKNTTYAGTKTDDQNIVKDRDKTTQIQTVHP